MLERSGLHVTRRRGHDFEVRAFDPSQFFVEDWETVIRGIAPDVSLGGYFDIVLDQLAPAYRPEDVYAGNYLGSLEAIDAGVTTLLDWSRLAA